MKQLPWVGRMSELIRDSNGSGVAGNITELQNNHPEKSIEDELERKT